MAGQSVVGEIHHVNLASTRTAESQDIGRFTINAQGYVAHRGVGIDSSRHQFMVIRSIVNVQSCRPLPLVSSRPALMAASVGWVSRLATNLGDGEVAADAHD